MQSRWLGTYGDAQYCSFQPDSILELEDRVSILLVDELRDAKDDKVVIDYMQEGSDSNNEQVAHKRRIPIQSMQKCNFST